MPKEVAEAIEPDEHDVQEVRCAISGLPISSVPAWYATVNVRFVSDAARQKSGGATPAPRLPEIVDTDTDTDDSLSNNNEISLEDVDEDIPVEDIPLEDIEIDLGEVEAEEDIEAEPEAEV